MYTLIQHATERDRRTVISLDPGSYVAPSGNVIGKYRVVFPCLTREAALKILAVYFQKNCPVSLWWHGAAEDIAALINV